MSKALTTLLFIIPLFTFSQSEEDDQITLDAAIDWLDRKLNYIYYEEAAQKWWLNRFYVNEKKEVTLKNIFTDKPRSANIKEKVYLIRKFKLEDINPYQISIRKIDKDQGRIVKGKMLELKTFSGSRAIHKTVDGRRGTDVSFVQISFPTFMTDSIADYAELVRSKFKEAIIATTKVYATGNTEEDKNEIFSLLQGNFTTEEGQKMIATKKFEQVILIHGNVSQEQYFGFDSNKGQFYLTTISNEGVNHEYYTPLAGNQLVLQSVQLKSNLISFETKNSIRVNGVVYYRE